MTGTGARRGGLRVWTRLCGSFLWLPIALSPVTLVAPLPVAATDQAVPLAAPRPEIATFVGAPNGGAPAAVAQQPFGVAVSGHYTYVADPVNHVVRLIIGQSEYAFAGNGGLSVEGDGQDPAQAQLAGPYAVAPGDVVSTGFQVTGFDVYIADTFGHQVRQVTVTIPPIDSASGVPTAVIRTIAGTGQFGFDGDGPLQAASARLNSPYGVAWDPVRKIVYVADTLNNRIAAIHGGTITTLVGTPLNHPRGLAVDSAGRVLIADTYNNVVRRFDPVRRHLETVAANLSRPSGIALDGQDNLYVADTGNNLIRRFDYDAGKKTYPGATRVVAGSGAAGYGGDEGPALQASLNAPFGVAVRADGDLVIADTGNSYLRLVDAAPAPDGTRHIHRLAGTGTPSFAGDGQPAALVQLAGPSAVANRLAPPDPLTPGSSIPQTSGDRYVLDTFNHAVRWFATSQPVQTIAGVGGVPGPASTGVAAGSTHFDTPMGMSLDIGHNILYVADTFNNEVRSIDLATKKVGVVAGTGSPGYNGDGIAAISAQLSYPTGLAVDSAGNLFIADSYNARIRRVDRPYDPSHTGLISTVAGTGVLGFTGDGGQATAADLYFPYGVTVDAAQPPTLLITDSFNHRVRAVRPNHTIQTVAGNGHPDFIDGQIASAGALNRPWSTALDASGLYIADFLNHRVRKVDAGGVLTTVAGVGSSGLLGDFGKAAAAEVDGPRALSAIGNTGALLVADSFNDRVRWIGLTKAGVYATSVNFKPQNLATLSPTQAVRVTSTGSGLLVLGAVDTDPLATDFMVDQGTNSCSHQRLEPGVSCGFGVAFDPRRAGSRTGSVVIPDDAADNPQLVSLSGRGTAPVMSFSAPSLSFSQPPGKTAPPQALRLTNTGDGPLTNLSISVRGTDFAQSNTCPGSLAPGQECVITVSFAEVASGERTGALAVSHDTAAHASPILGVNLQLVPLFGAVIAPAVALNPSGLTFHQNLGTSSPAQVVQLVNTGDGPLNIVGIRDSGDFVQTNNCSSVIAPKASCAISVTFTPSATGERDGTITVADDARDTPQTISLVGTGTVPSADVSPRRLVFSQNLGASSRPQVVVLSNPGDGPLTVSGIAITGDYAQSNNCPGVLAPSEHCTISVSFAPRATGARDGSLIITDDADSVPQSQQMVSLTGRAFAPAVSLTPATLTYGANLGTSAPPQTVILTNTGDGLLTIRGVSLTGDSADYAIVGNTCGGSVQPGATCFISVSFTPHAQGLRPASLVVVDDARGSPHTVQLRGVGTGPHLRLSATALDFGSLPAGQVSTTQTVTVVNDGTGTLAIYSIMPSGQFQFSGCGSTLGAGASCTLTVWFTPSGPSGGRLGSLSIFDNAGDNPRQIGLSGSVQ